MRCIYQGLDYREIPQKLLDSNIPEGRGMIKWAPFKTMPEQYERVSMMIDEQEKCNPPSFDSDTILMIEKKLKSSIGKSVILRYWNDGFEISLECKVEYLDHRTGLIVVSKGIELINIKFKYIYEIT